MAKKPIHLKAKNYLKSRLQAFGLNKLLGFAHNDVSLICYFDTGISSLNLGDEIINDNGRRTIEKLFAFERIFITNTHCGISGKTISTANRAKYRIVCGTNLLDSNIGFGGGSWNINAWDCIRMGEVILMGVGWSEYSRKIPRRTEFFLKHLLSKTEIHSVRDEYTKLKLQSIGITNVINTGCPTIWNLNKGHCDLIPKRKASMVVFTLTDYARDYAQDAKLIEILAASYEKIFFWPQGYLDLNYLNGLNVTAEISILPPRLAFFDKFLSENDSDYVGTRLHGGIRALQHKRRSIIISIDNRAVEMGRDYNLPIVSRDDIDGLLIDQINGAFDTQVRPDLVNISEWKRQFVQK